MTLTFTDAVRNARANAYVDLIDAGAGSNGTIEVATTGFGTVLLIFGLNATAFDAAGTAGVGIATLQSVPISTTGEVGAGAGAKIADYRIKDADGNVVAINPGGAGVAENYNFAPADVQNGGSNITISAGHEYAPGNSVSFSVTSGDLPAGLAENEKYYVTAATATTFQVARTPGGSAIVFGDQGTGTFTVTEADLAMVFSEITVASGQPVDLISFIYTEPAQSPE